MQYHGYLDRFTIINQCVVADGWANEQNLELWYDGKAISICHTITEQPGLVAGFGEEARSWGFSLCAALPTSDIDRTKFKLRLNSAIVLTDPPRGFRRHDDYLFEVMTKRFRDHVAEHKGSFLEIGSRARSSVNYKSWFPSDIDYVGMDITPGPNVDVIGDAHHLSRVIKGPFKSVFSIAVFEHILMPWKVALEMNKVMENSALALIISHGSWPSHEELWDFFRFSKDAWKGIFNRHTGFEVVDAQYQFQASIVPHYMHARDFERMSKGSTYLLSGCLVRRVAPALVAWDAEAGDVYNLGYDHA